MLKLHCVDLLWIYRGFVVQLVVQQISNKSTPRKEQIYNKLYNNLQQLLNISTSLQQIRKKVVHATDARKVDRRNGVRALRVGQCRPTMWAPCRASPDGPSGDESCSSGDVRQAVHRRLLAVVVQQRHPRHGADASSRRSGRHHRRRRSLHRSQWNAVDRVDRLLEEVVVAARLGRRRRRRLLDVRRRRVGSAVGRHRRECASSSVPRAGRP